MKKSKLKKIIEKSLSEFWDNTHPKKADDSWNDLKFTDISEMEMEKIDKLILGLSNTSEGKFNVYSDRINIMTKNYSISIVKEVGIIIDKLSIDYTLRLRYNECFDKLYTRIKDNITKSNIVSFNEIYTEIMSMVRFYSKATSFKNFETKCFPKT